MYWGIYVDINVHTWYTCFFLGRLTASLRRGPQEGQHAVDFTDTKKWRAAGMWMMIVGFISMVFCFVVGNFRPR